MVSRCWRVRWPGTWPRLRRGQAGVLAGVLLVGFADRVTVVIGDQWFVFDAVANMQTAWWWMVKAPVLVVAVAGWIWRGRRRLTRVPADARELTAVRNAFPSPGEGER